MTLHCDICGSEEYFAASPGTDAEEQQQGNLFVLQPAPAVPMQVWCFEHWPQRAALIPHHQPQPESPAI